MSDIAISVTDICKTYEVFDKPLARMRDALGIAQKEDVKRIKAIDGVSFEVKRGEAVALIGQNGSGKTTLLEMVTGALAPTGGEIKVNGRVSALLELGSGFNPEYTGRENVVLNGLLLGLKKKEILDRFSEIEAFAEIGSAIDRPVRTYSTGMAMRLAFAVQVLCDPDVLIVDEALSVGDFFFQQKCFSHIRELRARGLTLLFVSHDMSAVRDLCGRGILMVSGQIEFDGDKLEAIRRFTQQEDVSQPAQADPIDSHFKHDFNIRLEQPFWSAPINDRSSSEGFIVAVGIYDEVGKPILSAKMGSKITIKVQYCSYVEEPIHVHLVIKNKHDCVVTAFGSYSLRESPPFLSVGQNAVFELETQMSLEAGSYSLLLSLNGPNDESPAGRRVDETPWLGPIHVEWNYEQEVPPFYGQVGLPTSVRYLK
jgi:lipopolysaccharide transport system ATP-binding protein